MSRIHSITALTVLLLSLGLVTSLHSAKTTRARYTITDLGTLGGGESSAIGLNDQGDVVGNSDIPSDTPLARTLHTSLSHAFLWNRGHMSDLDRGRATYISFAYGINDKGECVGSSDTVNRIDSAACLWQGGRRQFLGTLGGDESAAWGVNDKGQVCGFASAGVGLRHAFLWQNGKMTDLSPGAGRHSLAYSLNDRGQVVGDIQVGRQQPRAVVWSHGRMTDLGLLPGGKWSEAHHVNNSGEVVGAGDDASGDTQAIVWTLTRRLSRLGTLGGKTSVARGINSRGQIVGDADTAHQVRHACLWWDGKMVDLNTAIPPGSGRLLRWGEAINDRGQIAVIGLIKGKRHAFLLTPRPE